MDRNAVSSGSSHVGRGQALLQGLLKCGLHDAAMSPKYKKSDSGRSYHGYECQGEMWKGGPRCKRVTSRGLEEAVVSVVKQRLQPPAVETIREEWRTALEDGLAEDRRYAAALRALRQQEADLHRRYMLVDPQNRMVAAALERELELAKRAAIEREEAGPPRSVTATFTEEDFDELLALCNDLPALWDAPTTEARDRKEIIRALVRMVIVDDLGETVRARIVWNDGLADEPLKVPRTEGKHRLVREMAAEGLRAAEIAERLNELGIRTLKGTSWTRRTVYATLYWHRRREREGGHIELPARS